MKLKSILETYNELIDDRTRLFKEIERKGEYDKYVLEQEMDGVSCEEFFSINSNYKKDRILKVLVELYFKINKLILCLEDEEVELDGYIKEQINELD